MTPRSPRFHLLLIFLLILVVPAAVSANDSGTEPTDEAPAAPAPDRIYSLSGVTISWDLENEKFHAPTAAQAARISAAFASPSPAEKIEIETLPDGTEKARVPVYLFSASAVRVGSEGELAGYCAEPGAEISSPAANAEEE